MNILIAADKFKGSLDAREVAQNIAKGLRDALPDAKIDIVPMADGGEGTAEVICDARGGSWLKCKAHDPLGREIDARYAWIESGKIAVMEMSEVAGMRRVSEDERDPVQATTFGVGEMILDATNRGANEIIIGLGGSATNDGGFGIGSGASRHPGSGGKAHPDRPRRQRNERRWLWHGASAGLSILRRRGELERCGYRAGKTDARRYTLTWRFVSSSP